jgi:hypothetical protein
MVILLCSSLAMAILLGLTSQSIKKPPRLTLSEAAFFYIQILALQTVRQRAVPLPSGVQMNPHPQVAIRHHLWTP